LGEDTKPLEISELLFSSFVAVWISIHTIRDRTKNSLKISYIQNETFNCR